MLPRCPDNASQAKSSLEGKLDCMSLNGYSYTARENVDLNRYYAASAVWAWWSRHCTACHQQLGSMEQKNFLTGCSQLQVTILLLWSAHCLKTHVGVAQTPVAGRHACKTAIILSCTVLA